MAMASWMAPPEPITSMTFLLFRGELDFGHEDLITDNTIAGERAETG